MAKIHLFMADSDKTKNLWLSFHSHGDDDDDVLLLLLSLSLLLIMAKEKKKFCSVPKKMMIMTMMMTKIEKKVKNPIIFSTNKQQRIMNRLGLSFVFRP